MADKPMPLGLDLLRAASSMIPVFGSPIEILLTSAISRDLHRVQQALDASIAATGSPEELHARLEENERLEVLFAEGMRAASSSADEAKRRLLGQALLHALTDEARVDESELLVTVLRELWPPHVRALERLRHIRDSYSVAERESGPPADGTNLRSAVRAQWKSEPLAVTAVLVRTGTAIAPPSTYAAGAPIAEGISPYGILVLDALRVS